MKDSVCLGTVKNTNFVKGVYYTRLFHMLLDLRSRTMPN